MKIVRPAPSLEVRTLIRLAQLDAELRQIAQVEQAIARALHDLERNLAGLARTLERRQVAIDTAQMEHARLAAAKLEQERRRTEPLLARLRRDADRSHVERAALLGGLGVAAAAQYQQLANLGRFPFIVPTRDGRCTGCALRLSETMVRELDDPDAIEPCPRCLRMLYGGR